ncbi:HNH endonuclease [Tumebacillus flagellatus]|uniref:HNH endonuclease signature motif containing protein n=1 Tax=Tumebacillus flagellatus TaxID=1157490 RepID=UPI003B75C023
MKPGTQYPDFEKAGVIQKVDELPESMWQSSDSAQFEWLDSRIPGGRPKGTTWHHSEIPGRMELVPFGVHNITFHKGGRSPGLWAYRPSGR